MSTADEALTTTESWRMDSWKEDRFWGWLFTGAET